MGTTRRGFLKGAVVGTAATGVACRHEIAGQAAEHPEAPAKAGGASELVALRFEVNGGVAEQQVRADDSALSVLRESLSLTGCKLGCGHGACGACTVQLDGEPVTTCLLPAVKLEGRRVRTVEGLVTTGVGEARELHPVQRAFIAEDAMQCGYCTPGFVVEAAAFHDRWRAHQGTKTPTREEIAAALSGHLCRCGAYGGIYRAVTAACEGKHDDGPQTGPRVDAPAKVTGEAVYTVDIYDPEMLVGRFLRSPHAHAKVRALDYQAALDHPGVFAVVEFVSVGRKIRFVGQEIVALAAVDARTAHEALAKVRVEYEVLEPVVDIEAATAAGAPELYGTRKARKRAPSESEGPVVPAAWTGNLRGPFKLFSHHRGRARRRLDEAAAGQSGESYASGRFETSAQNHTALEPRAAFAEWIAEDALLVHASTQAVRHLAEDIADHWRLDPEKVVVRADYIGGAFGAKTWVSVEIRAAIDLAKLSGRPVRVVNDRREELTVGGLRPAVRTDIEIADAGEGQPAIRATSYSDAGVAVGATNTVLMRLQQAHADLDIADYDVLTSTPPGCPFRGPGGPPAFFALEQAIDELAIEQGADPLALRRRWNENEVRALVLDWVANQPLWRDRPPALADTGRYRRGVGMAFGTWFYFAEPATRVQVSAGPTTKGEIVVSTACQDMGNGTRTVLADAVAEVLDMDPNQIRVNIGSSQGVHGPMSAGSRTATSVGPAAVMAATELREELLERAREQMRLSGAKPVAGGVEHRGTHYPWSEIVLAGPDITTTGKRKRDKGGWFLPPIMGVTVGRYLSSAAQISEVEVDTRLGRVRALRSVAGVAVGRIYSPALARNQVEGGLVQGIGYTLYEERRLDPRHGTILTGGLEDYRLCGIADVGELEVDFIPGGYDKVVGGGIGIGELSSLTPAATLANAVRHATGWRPTQIPLRPDRVLAGLAQTQAEKAQVPS